MQKSVAHLLMSAFGCLIPIAAIPYPPLFLTIAGRKADRPLSGIEKPALVAGMGRYVVEALQGATEKCQAYLVLGLEADQPVLDAKKASLSSAAQTLPGQAHVLWETDLRERESAVRAWAEELEAGSRESAAPSPGIAQIASVSRNPDWTREEHTANCCSECSLRTDWHMRLNLVFEPQKPL